MIFMIAMQSATATYPAALLFSRKENIITIMTTTVKTGKLIIRIHSELFMQIS